MTGEAKQPRKRRAKAEPATPTEYVVLEHREFAPVEAAPTVTAWVVLGEATTIGEKRAIDAVVGEKGGVFKAVAKRSWKGGERRFEQTKIVGEAID